ncbi:MAG TPA: YwiC-like family protein, partial [Bacteroidota bacterium]|nr:YwiC-like family protein [Bacteroidota bacterium]
MSIRGAIIPKEHGAWAVLLVPMIVVSCVVETFSLNLLLLAGSTLAMFMSSGPLQMILRNRLVGCLETEKSRDAKFSAKLFFLSSLMLATPLLQQGFWLLAGFGFLAAVSFFLSFFISKGTHKTIQSDLLAV